MIGFFFSGKQVLHARALGWHAEAGRAVVADDGQAGRHSIVTHLPLARKDEGADDAQVALVVAVYGGLLIGASIPFVIFDWPPRIGWWGLWAIGW